MTKGKFIKRIELSLPLAGDKGGAVLPEVAVGELLQCVDSPRVSGMGENAHQIAGIGGGGNQAAQEPHSQKHPLPQGPRQGGDTLTHQAAVQLQPYRRSPVSLRAPGTSCFFLRNAGEF